jgi:hypothetical protein
MGDPDATIVVPSRRPDLMNMHYRHTQVGWVMLVAVAAAIALGWGALPPEAAVAARIPLLLIVALLLLGFGTLTVEVSEDAIRLWFGIGLIRKRIPLREVRSWREFRNPWYTGWGIRMGPGGVVWNVSGFDAVQLELGGKRFRIGTDEPAELVAAITRAKGETPAPTGTPEAPGLAAGRLSSSVGLLVLALGIALVGALFYSQVRPPRVAVDSQGLEIETPFYGTSVAAADIVGISLEPRLPRVLRRTNGFAGAGTLRGHFRIEELGEGRLYVEQGFAPYLLVRLRRGYVIVNFREPGKTRTLYDEMARIWPDRVTRAAGPT